MLGDTDEANRRKPFEFLSNIFKRRREHDENESDIKPPDIRFEESNFYNQSWVSDQDQGLPMHASLSPRPIQSSPINHLSTPSVSHISSMTSTPSPIRSSIMIATATVGIPLSPHPSSNVMMTSSPSHVTYLNGWSTPPPSMLSSCSSPNLIHQTPIKSRDIGEDMEAIRLSRQDNPYLQKVGGSRTSLIDDESPENGQIIEEEDTVHLVSHHHTHSRGLSDDSIISLSEVHEHLIRSPPPTSVPKILAERGIFVFPADISTSANTISSGKSHSLNPLNPVVSRGHEDVLDQNLRQVLDTQRKLSTPKADVGNFSCSVPGSPARIPSQSLPLHVKISTHSRTHSEEVPTLQYSCNTFCTHIVAEGAGVLGPVVPPGKKHPSSNEVLLTRPLLANSQSSASCFSPPLKPLNRHNQSKRGSSILRGSSVPPSNNGSSTSLTLPIKCPHQPAVAKIT